MPVDLDAAIARWKSVGPLTDESLRLLVELREAALTDQPQELLWAAFVKQRQQTSALQDEHFQETEGNERRKRTYRARRFDEKRCCWRLQETYWRRDHD